MAAIKFLLLLLIKTCLSLTVNELFNKINKDVGKYNTIAANIAWEASVNPGNPELVFQSKKYQKERIIWQHQICDKLATLFHSHSLNSTQRRQSYLLCRGPKYTFNEAKLTSDLYEELRIIYANAEVCIPNDKTTSIESPKDVEAAILNYLTKTTEFTEIQEGVRQKARPFRNDNDNKVIYNNFSTRLKKYDKDMVCLKGEDDFNKMMSVSRKEEVLRWLWLTWREIVGPPMIKPYNKLVNVENRAARRNGYSNIGAAWRDELEIPNLRQYCRNLYSSIRPLYNLLHGVVRFYLRRFYGPIVPERGFIPAHLLGNLWSQNWEFLADLMLPKTIDLDKSIKKLNWTVMHMVKTADDYYQSLFLPAMSDKFWRESVFSRDNNTKARCHGTAADMFQDGDFRLLYCSETSTEDFYVLHHELGHIQYYMAYEQQPPLFRQANSALHEAIGDTIMYGVLTPQHLNRLGLINDSLLYTNNSENYEEKTEINKNNPYYNRTKDGIPKLVEDGDATIDFILLLKQALNKIPQIPFALLLDEYRWKYFEGGLEHPNEEFWDLVIELQGIAPPGERGEQYFDAGAKFHVPDNTPYIRYFLSSFLQHQLFERLCSASIFGRWRTADSIPDSIILTRCDLYGSKAVGKMLKELMSKGHSQHWSEILQSSIGESDITAAALLNYYKPLQKVLQEFVIKYQVPIDW